MELVEGRRYKDEPTPINESLERHYKDEKKRLEARISELEDELNEAKLEIKRLEFRNRLKDMNVESLLTTMAGGEI